MKSRDIEEQNNAKRDMGQNEVREVRGTEIESNTQTDFDPFFSPIGV